MYHEPRHGTSKPRHSIALHPRNTSRVMPLRSGVREHLTRARKGGAEVGLEDEPSASLRTFASGGRKRARTLRAYFKSLSFAGRICPPGVSRGCRCWGRIWINRCSGPRGSLGLDIEGANVALATGTLSLNCPGAATSHSRTAHKSHSGIRTNTNAPCRRATFYCLMRSFSGVLSQTFRHV